MSVDWTKPIQLRDGRKAEFVRRVREEYWIVTEHGGLEVMMNYHRDGRMCRTSSHEHPGDVINQPEEKLLGVINIYLDSCSYHPSREAADRRKKWPKVRTHVITVTRCGDEVQAIMDGVQ